jgi:filamentous hemagglutinin
LLAADTTLAGANNTLPPSVVDSFTIQSSSPSGLSTRLDAVGTDQNGIIQLTDAKGSANAPLTPNQTIVYPELPIYGGVVVGKGKPPYIGGTIIPPTPVTIIRKN